MFDPAPRSFPVLFLLLTLALSLASPQAIAREEPAPILIDNVEIKSDVERPSVCFIFDHSFGAIAAAELEPYVSLEVGEQRQDFILAVHGRRLCVSGMAHGTKGYVRLRKGLPNAEGARFQFNRAEYFTIPDREPRLAFRESGTLLPADLAEGIPLSSVNVARVELELLRLGERNLADRLAYNKLNKGLYSWDIQQMRETQGESLWQGEMAIETEPNRDIETVIPVGEILAQAGGQAEPGVYVLLATTKHSRGYYHRKAVQWFVISDIALSSYRSDAGLLVEARSLASALPLAGIALNLLARNNKVLGKAVTDGEGRARFAAGLLRGEGGNRPLAIYGQGKDGDFVFLDVSGPGLDLRDRGAAGRRAPGPLDAFVTTERGLYRPGETVHVVLLLRDEIANAESGLPMTLRMIRPDGEEFRRAVVQDRLGGYRFDFALPNNAPGGAWSIEALADPEGAPIGRSGFRVADFVPPQIELSTEAGAASYALGEIVNFELQADWLYGAPAASLRGEATPRLRAARHPFPAFPGYRFGLEDEPFVTQTFSPVKFTTDALGQARDFLTLPEELSYPTGSQPVEASLEIVVFDLAGRPVTKWLSLPLRDGSPAIGVKPLFKGDRLGWQEPAVFDVILLDAEGQRIAAETLHWTLSRFDRDWVWYWRDGSRVVETLRDERVVREGEIAIAADRVNHLKIPVDRWGDYRLTVSDAKGEVTTSVGFSSGWATSVSQDRPDAVRVTLDKAHYRPGETAKVQVSPPYSSSVTLWLADQGLTLIEQREVGPEGTTFKVPIPAEQTTGFHILASAQASAEAVRGPLPRRAFGLEWLALDPDGKDLGLTLSLPERAEPDTRLAVELAVAHPEEQSYALVMAVDEGVLQLSGHETPDPLAYFLQRRQLDITLHDVYGELINGRGTRIGQVRSGGGGGFGHQDSVLATRSSEIFAWTSEIVALRADGTARVELDLPDFTGRARIMAIAWSETRLGSAEASTAIRSPLVARMTLPRFLAPGDEAEITVSLHNIDAPEGDYSLRFETSKQLRLDQAALSLETLRSGEEQRLQLHLTAEALGIGDLAMIIYGPEGFTLRRELKLAVRPGQPRVTERHVARLPAGAAVSVSDQITTAFRPETASVTVTVSGLPDFDLATLLAQLDRYPYGCLEQTTSRALPLLYLSSLAKAAGIAEDDRDLHARVQDAIYRVVAYQVGGGGYSLWGYGEAGLWLTAYATDFLARARAVGYDVPDIPYQRGIAWMQQRLRTRNGDSWYNALYAEAFAHYVLARAGAGDLSTLRYFYETNRLRFYNDLARAQVAAALALLGDRRRAEEAFRHMVEAHLLRPRLTNWNSVNYGSPLRDRAAILGLMVESGIFSQESQGRLLILLAEEFAERRWLSTQEMAAVTLTAAQLLGSGTALRLARDGQEEISASGRYRERIEGEALKRGLSLRNLGEESLYQIVTLDGIPAAPPPPSSEGFIIEREVYDLRGKPLEPTVLRQNERVVVIIRGHQKGQRHQNALVAQLLPAGWEIEPTALEDDKVAADLIWLPKHSKTERVERRDDRYIAQIDLTERESFTVAFVARAVTPGNFVLPGAFIEDMFRPDQHARGATQRIAVTHHP